MTRSRADLRHDICGDEHHDQRRELEAGGRPAHEQPQDDQYGGQHSYTRHCEPVVGREDRGGGDRGGADDQHEEQRCAPATLVAAFEHGLE
jgi:hypothetical protein